MTLHRRAVDVNGWLDDGEEPLPLPAGWQIAEGNADDIRVCNAHPWHSHALVFANGDRYGTSGCCDPKYKGECAAAIVRHAQEFNSLPDA
jgi:hypothetical protein